MLPSKGYFSAIPCVFYLAGNCERPHCHYRHCARDKTNNINDDLESPSDAVEERNWLGSNLSESFVTQMVEKAVDKVFVEDPKKAETLDRDHIIKTALDKLKEETLKAKINPNQKAHSSSIGVPSYKPTPIAELNKRHIPVMYAPERPLSAIRKEKGPDDKNPISISALSSSSIVATDPFKQWGESEDSKCTLNSCIYPTPIHDSVIEENSLDANDIGLHNTVSVIIDCQVERNCPGSDRNNDDVSSSKASFHIVTNQVDTVCDDVFTELGINGMLTEQHDITKDLPLDCDNGLLAANTFNGRTIETTDLIESTSSHTLKMMEVKGDKDDMVCNVTKADLPGYKLVVSGNVNQQITEVEKRTSHKHGSKSHTSKKSEGAKSSDKHRNKKSSNVTTSSKLERRSTSSSKVKHKSKDREKNEEQNEKIKCKSKSETERNPHFLPRPSSKESPARDVCSKVKRVEKGSERYSKSNEKSDRKDKHTEKPKDEKKSHGSKFVCDELKTKASGTKHSSFKHSSYHHKQKSNDTSSYHTKTESVLRQNEVVSETKKRKHDNQLHRPDKRMKGLSKSTPDGNYISTEINIFADSKKGSSLLTTSSAYSSDISDDAFDDPGFDEMDPNSMMYSPPTQEIDSISISSADSTTTTGNCKEDWMTVTSRKSKTRRRNSEKLPNSTLKLEGMTPHQVESVGTPSDTKWTKAKEMIQKTHTSKIRIAHVPNVSNILSAKTRLLSNKAPPSTPTNTYKTLVETEDAPMPRVTKRVAHGGQATARFPILVHSQDIKINASIRQHYCNIIYEELAKFFDAEEAMKKAAAEEFTIAKKCSHLKIYKNSSSLLLLKIRKSHGILQNEAPAEKLEPASTPEYTYGWSLYKCFMKYLMSDEELIQHGYPMPLPGQSSCAYTEKSARRYCVQQPDKPFTRKCANCGKLYEIDEDGMPTTSNDCFYHWGKLRKIPGRAQAAEKFTCCDGADDATPCQSSVYHVWSGQNEDCMPGFVKTREFHNSKDDSSAGIFALDCEMCYTTRGLELARLTVVNVNGDVVFDEVVSLESPVLDYCTRFSGIDEDKIKLATYTFSDVQKWVLDNVYDKTILVGHSLENDLKVLKIFHKRIVDTSVTFPHKFGLPQKCSLKFLASSLLSMTIQESENGHDSKEDAVTCLKLIMKKIKDDSKIRKPRLEMFLPGEDPYPVDNRRYY